MTVGMQTVITLANIRMMGNIFISLMTQMKRKIYTR
ncbi:unknown [Roseburia sp. CAG:197]|nr:unknown [Roseburia sp. CAG:197]